jgi:hypothetical protein
MAHLYFIKKAMLAFLSLIMTLNLINAQSNISIESSAFVSSMMERFIENGKRNETVRAWRIQIITTDDRREMESVRAKFTSMYPTISMEWKHEVPYYQVRVGAFESKIKMMPFLLELRKSFPAATPVQDNISKRTLLNN